MHIAFIIATIIIALIWADWRNWRKYHSTMLFVAVGNLLYNFLYKDHYLWQMKTTILPGFMAAELLYTFILLPLAVMLFLSGYPGKLKLQILRNLKYIAVFTILEWVYFKFGKIIYNYGWNVWCSLAWDSMMFPMWALHHKRPLMAYGVSIAIVAAMLILFPIDWK